MHINLEVSLSAGIFASRTVGDPGAHGAGVTGTHGIGVSTPRAAVVAAATVGFASEEHMPNGMMFVIGILSMMLAAGVPVNTAFVGSTTRLDGAAPKLHCNIAPMQTRFAISSFRAKSLIDLDHRALEFQHAGAFDCM